MQVKIGRYFRCGNIVMCFILQDRPPTTTPLLYHLLGAGRIFIKSHPRPLNLLLHLINFTPFTYYLCSIDSFYLSVFYPICTFHTQSYIKTQLFFKCTHCVHIIVDVLSALIAYRYKNSNTTRTDTYCNPRNNFR